MGWLIVLVVILAGAYWLEKVSQRNKKDVDTAVQYGNVADENWRWLKEHFEETIKVTRATLADKHVEVAKYRKQYGRPSYEEKELLDQIARNEKEYKELGGLYAEVGRFEYRTRDRKGIDSKDIKLLTKHLMVVFGRAANSYGARGLEGLWGADGQQYEKFLMERQESEKIARRIMQKYD